jgi:hypothetical protein
MTRDSNTAEPVHRNKAAHSSLLVLWLGCVCVLLAAAGCCSSHPQPASSRRPFNFQADTFAYPNELVWEYGYDQNGKWSGHPRTPQPEYFHHCFVVARAAKQFLEHARFDTNLPVADTNTYRKLIRRVAHSNTTRFSPESEKIVIPGYPDLHTFSAAQAPLLKAECGGAWKSYFQRGHWRIMMPFSHGFEERQAKQLVADIKDDRPPVVHLICFPSLRINHALLLFDVTESEKEIRFSAYDPNDPSKPATLTFDRTSRTFQLPYNTYFPGGKVNVYEVYRNWHY